MSEWKERFTKQFVDSEETDDSEHCFSPYFSEEVHPEAVKQFISSLIEEVIEMLPDNGTITDQSMLARGTVTTEKFKQSLKEKYLK